MDQSHVTANGLSFNVYREGSGHPLLLIHGWPEFARTWDKVVPLLAGQFSVVAPDLRGFGASDKPDAGPSNQAGSNVHADDMLAVLDALGIAKVGVVAHDVGAYVGQFMAHSHPERLAGLFFFDTPYPGIGSRGAAPAMLKEVWYQSFHQLPWAASLVGASRETCRTYFSHFLRHWCVNKAAFDDAIEAWVDNFMQPGNLQGGFNWYISNNAWRQAMLAGELPVPAPIAVPTCVRWGEGDPVLPPAWGDRLGEFFSDLDFQVLPGVGHFPHRENPRLAADEIARFFGGLPAAAWQASRGSAPDPDKGRSERRFRMPPSGQLQCKRRASPF